MKILLLGSSGYFGSNLHSDVHEIVKPDLRLEKIENNTGYLKQFDCIVNCAVKIDQDRAETDREYRKEMYCVNAHYAIMLGEVFDGYIAHISTPYITNPEINHYSRSKYMAHFYYQSRPNSLILIPAHPYGGEKRSGFHRFLENNLDNGLILEDDCEFNIINIEDFWKKAIELIEKMGIGEYCLYEDAVYNKYTFANKLFGERNNWKAGTYTKDIAKRPKNWRIDWSLRNV